MSVRKSVAWAFAGQFVSFGTAFAGSVIIARLLSPHELGIYVIAIATLGVLQVVAQFGASTYVVREKELLPHTLSAAFTVNAILALFLSSVVFGVSFVGGALLGDPAAGKVLRLLALSPLIGIFGFRPGAMLQREMQFKTIALVSSAAVVVATSISVGAALRGWSYMSPAFGGVAGALVTTIAYNLVARPHAGLSLSLVGWREMTRFGLQMISVSGISTLINRTSDIILGRVLGIASLGLYSRASSLSNMIFENLYGTATRVVFTQMAEDYRERGELRTTFLRGLQMITACMWPLLVGLAVLARPAIHILYGEKWLAAAAPLSCLLLAQVLVLGYGMNWELFVLRHELGKQTRIEIFRLLVQLVCFTIGCQFGLAGAAMGTVLASAVGVVVYAPHMHRLSDTPHGELRRIYVQSGVLTLVAVAPSLALMVANNWSPRTSPLSISLCICLGIVLWLILLALLRHPFFDELRRGVRGVPGLRQLIKRPSTSELGCPYHRRHFFDYVATDKGSLMYLVDRLKSRVAPFSGLIPFNEYRKVKNAAPFTAGSITLFGDQIHFSDNIGLLHSVREIFGDEVYKFRAKSDAPHIIDAGANIGLSVIYFRRLYPRATVVAYEPDREIFGMLRKNVGGYPGVELHEAAAWTHDTELTFFSEGSLAGSVTTDFLNKGVSTTVRAESLKKQIRKRPVDFLKIDIEGAENTVLFDIEDELAQVDTLFFEYHSSPDDAQRLGDMLNLVGKAGFRYIINGTHGPRLPFIETVKQGFDLQLNVSCFRPG